MTSQPKVSLFEFGLPYEKIVRLKMPAADVCLREIDTPCMRVAVRVNAEISVLYGLMEWYL